MHTNDAAGAFMRMIDMGVEPFLVSSTVSGVMAQRLVRVLCPECRQEYKPQPDDVPDCTTVHRQMFPPSLACESSCVRRDLAGDMVEYAPTTPRLRVRDGAWD